MVSDKTRERYKNTHTDEWYDSLDENTTKQCSTCQKVKTVDNFSKHRKQADGFNYQCRQCVKEHNYKRGINLNFHKSRAKRNGLEFNITYEDVFLPEYCPILNIKLDYGADKSNSNSPSIDRIDNTKGYIKGNIIVMSRLANAMKSSASFDELELFCKNILKLVNYYKIEGTLGNVTDVFSIKERSLDS